jgi:plastocyanin
LKIGLRERYRHPRLSRLAVKYPPRVGRSAAMNKAGMTTAGIAIIVLVLGLGAVSAVYVTSTQGSSDQLASQAQQISALKAELQQLAAQQRGLNSSLGGLGGNLPAVNQRPTVRVVTVEWAEFLSLQDRFFTNFIIVNAGDTVDVEFISNDTASHTFTIDSPYNFQINGSIPGTVDDPTGQTFTTQPTNNDGKCTPTSRPGNVTCEGSFVAKYPGIYEYYCVYHIHLGMFGYLVVLPNKAYSGPSVTTTTTTTSHPAGAQVMINLGAGGSSNPSGFAPDTIRVVIGVNNTVTWVNNDGIDHTATSDTGLFNSEIIPPGGSYSFTFTTPGTYTYGCEFHPLMKGTVVVVASG